MRNNVNELARKDGDFGMKWQRISGVRPVQSRPKQANKSHLCRQVANDRDPSEGFWFNVGVKMTPNVAFFIIKMPLMEIPELSL